VAPQQVIVAISIAVIAVIAWRALSRRRDEE
jgi:hypothetical protein